MESATAISTILEKKTKEYGTNFDNFKAESELMVTITLKEYRELVSNVATKDGDIKKANEDKYVRETKIKQLTDEVNELRNKNYELIKKLEEFE